MSVDFFAGEHPGAPLWRTGSGRVALVAGLHVGLLLLALRSQWLTLDHLGQERFFNLIPPSRPAAAQDAAPALLPLPTDASAAPSLPQLRLPEIVLAQPGDGTAPRAVRLAEPAAARASANPAAPAAPLSAKFNAPPAPAAAPAPSTRDGADSGTGTPGTARVIAMISLSAKDATYLFPALTGDEVHHVELGRYRDIESAVVHDVIARIRAHYPDFIFWESRRTLQKTRLSMHVEDENQISGFLREELFGDGPAVMIN